MSVHDAEKSTFRIANAFCHPARANQVPFATQLGTLSGGFESLPLRQYFSYLALASW
jgi:hypothetical protein